MVWRLVQYDGAYDAFAAKCTQEEMDSLRPRLAQVQIKGNQAGYPITDSLDDGLFEIRGRHKRVRLRLLFGFLPGKRVVVVLGLKKDQRTLAEADKKKARRLLKEAEKKQEGLSDLHFH